MARLIGNQGFIMNQSNGNAYLRRYARGKNDVGRQVRFTISGGNPNIHVNFKCFMAFTQTNASDFNAANTMYAGFFCDTNGNFASYQGTTWTCGANFDRGFEFSTRQADFWITTLNNGGFPGRMSICLEIFCDRWDYLSLSNPG
jgi:hypothetical protein